MKLKKIFTFWKEPSADNAYPGKVEDFGCRAAFRYSDRKTNGLGAYISKYSRPCNIADNKPMYAMNLTARGMYGTFIEFFDIGRRSIVKSFECLTTEHMHSIWRKKKR